MASEPTVKEKHLLEALKKIREVRRWALQEKIDPWVFRQALIIVMALDLEAALARGFGIVDILKFDSAAAAEAEAWLREGSRDPR